MKFKLLAFIYLLFPSFVFYSFQSNSKFSDIYVINELDSSKSLESELSHIVTQTFNELKVPGAIIGVWMNGYEPFKITLGVADLKTNQPIMINDKMRIGSITKTFTGTVLLQLVDEGKISLMDKLSKYFSDFPNAQNITIEQLGNMTSGIYNYSDDSIFVSRMMKDRTIPYTPKEVIDIALKYDPYFAPGEGFYYSNTNTILLGEIIEKITGNPLHIEIQNRILNPLKMTNTTFPRDTTFPNPHAKGYMYTDLKATEPTDVTLQNPNWGWSAGAMISTFDDVSKFAKPLATGELISSNSQTDRLKWGKTLYLSEGAWKDKPIRYGFTICDFNGAYGHDGSIAGYNSFMGYMPDKDATVIVLVNMQDTKEGIAPADYIAMMIIEKIKQM